MTKAEYNALVECFREARERAVSMESLKSQVTLESVVVHLADEIGNRMRTLNSKARNLFMDCI